MEFCLSRSLLFYHQQPLILFDWMQIKNTHALGPNTGYVTDTAPVIYQLLVK